MPGDGFKVLKMIDAKVRNINNDEGISQKIFSAVVNDLEEVRNADPVWKPLLIDQEPPAVPIIISIQNDIVIATIGDHSLIIGKKKSRKTLFLIWLLLHFAGDIETEVLWFDTEQGKRHVWSIFQKVQILTGKRINIFALRGKSPKERRDIISRVLKEWPTKIKLVIIDGVRDCLSNINDADQVSEVITWEESLIIEYGIHIINVLHQNKTDNNARGHIGSELLNKAFITIELEKEESSGCTIVTCESSRDGDFEKFAFTHDDNGLPEVVSMPVKGEVLTEVEQKERLKNAFDGELLKRGDLIKAIKSHFEVGKTKAEGLLTRYTRNGWIIKNGKDRSPNTVYKLAYG